MGLASRLRYGLLLMGQGLRVLPGALWVMLRLGLGRSRRERDAVARLSRAMATPWPGPEPLRPLEPGLVLVEPAYLGVSESDLDGPTVLHLIGTGENLYSPLVALGRLCAAQPGLGRCRHVFADTPHEPAAFLGPDEFGTRINRLLQPELERNPKGLVVWGLSRGGLAALEVGSRYAQSTGAPVGMLALAPPLCEQDPRPPTIALIGALELATDVLLRQMRAWLIYPPLGAAVIRWQYRRNCARVLAELEMDDEETVALYGHYLRNTDVGKAALRAVREFALLSRVSDAELRHALNGAMARLERCRQVQAHLVWGLADVWVEVDKSLERARGYMERSNLAPGCLTLHTLPGRNHGLSREQGKDPAPIAQLLWQACEHVMSNTQRSTRLGGQA